MKTILIISFTAKWHFIKDTVAFFYYYQKSASVPNLFLLTDKIILEAIYLKLIDEK